MNLNGNIILVKNLIFTGKNGMKYYDHAWETGRPTVILCESDDFYYGCSLSTTAPNTTNEFLLENNMVKYYDSKYNKTSMINVATFYELKICGYPIIGEIKSKDYILLLKFILNYYKNYNNEKINDFVLNDINNQLKLIK